MSEFLAHHCSFDYLGVKSILSKNPSLTKFTVYFQISVSEKLYLAMKIVQKVVLGRKLSNKGLLATKFKVHFSAESFLIMSLFNNSQSLAANDCIWKNFERT